MRLSFLFLGVLVTAILPLQLRADFINTPSSGIEIAFFGGDEPTVGKDKKLIDDLGPNDLAVQTNPGPLPGRELARRESNGANRVLVPLPKAERFAENVMRRILNGSNITGYEPNIEIVSDDMINAAAYPDGTVLISLGTFRNLESADEFAAILAHEFSHVLLKHHSSDWFMDAQNQGLAVYNFILDLKQEFEKLEKPTDKDSKFQDLKNRIIAETVVQASDWLLDAPFDRAQEDEADFLGTDLLIKAGYNPVGMTLMLDRLAAQEEINEIAKEEARQLRRKNISLSQDGGFFESLTGAFGDLAMDLKSELDDQLGKSHRDASERRSLVSNYLDTHYPDPTLVKISKSTWEQLVNDRDVENVLVGYRAALAARTAMTTYSLDDAAVSSREALKLLGSDHVLPRMVAAEISFLAGDFERAERFLIEGTAGYQPSIGVYQGLAETRVKLQNPDAALRTIAEANTELQAPPHLLPSKISSIHWRNKSKKSGEQKIETLSLIAQCRIEIIEGLDKLCEQATKGEFTVFHIDLPDGIDPGNVDPGTPAAPQARVQVTGEKGINARKGPGTTYPVIASFPYAAVLTQLSQRGDWIRVQDSAGTTAWVANWLTGPVGSAKPLAKPKPAPASKPVAKPAPAVSPEPATKPASAEAPETANESEKDALKDELEKVEIRLKKAKDLHSKGLMTDEEYEAERKKILNSL